MLLAAGRRFLLLLLLAGSVTVLGSVFFGVLAGASLERAISIGFYLVGSFLLVGGFFIGNRGPLRLKRPDEQPLLPFWGSRVVRWASLEEQEETINTSAVFVALGFVLVLLGIAIDSRHELF